MADLFRYAAFISYSSKDAKFARRLHRALETYGIPSSLGKFDLIGGGKKNRIYPVFRDREELSAGHLGDQIEANLKAAAALIVVCSPNGAASPWVQKEIDFFAGLRPNKIFAVIPDTAPLVDETGADCTQSCFPPAFKGDALKGDRPEPLAADARKGKDGFRNAWLKIVAGMIGVTPGQITDRDTKRRAQQRVTIGAAVVALAVLSALVGAIVDGRNWRSAMTAHANDVTSRGRPLEAAVFALAGLPAEGDAIAIAGSEAASTLYRTGLSLPIITDFGRLWGDDSIRFSGDGRFLSIQTYHGTLLRDLDNLEADPLLFDTTTSGVRFSGDGKFLFLWEGESAIVHVLGNPHNLPIALGRLDTAVFSGDGCTLGYVPFRISRHPSDSHFLLATALDGIRTLHALDSSRAALALGRNAGDFSCDGRFLVSQAGDGRATLRTLPDPDLEPLALGEIDRFSFSGDGRFLLTKNRDGTGRLYTLDNLTVAPISLGPILGFCFTPNGRFLLIGRQDGFSMRSLAELDDPEIQIGRLTALGFSPDDRYLFLQGADGNAVVRDIADARATVLPLASLSAVRPGEFQFSNRGRFLLTSDGAHATLHTLAAPFTALRVGDDVFELRRFKFSGDDRFLLTRDDRDNNWTLISLTSPEASRLTLGNIKNAVLSPDGRFLVTLDQSYNGVLRSLSDSGASLRGARLRAEVCQSSGSALRPLPPGLRANLASDTANLYRQLRGRPWNPCDWRGLLAVFPDAERGDGWFEGLRQWLRLMHVRHFRGGDWVCEETTSRASAAMRARRRGMCERVANRATIPAPS